MMFEVFASTILERDGKYVLVQEGKKALHGLWNLTGGHVDPGEKVVAGAIREAKEETGMDVVLDSVVHIFSSANAESHSIHFVFKGHIVSGEPTAGDDILQIGWYSLDEIKQFPENQLVAPWKIKAWLDDLEKGVSYPLSIIAEK